MLRAVMLMAEKNTFFDSIYWNLACILLAFLFNFFQFVKIA